MIIGIIGGELYFLTRTGFVLEMYGFHEQLLLYCPWYHEIGAWYQFQMNSVPQKDQVLALLSMNVILLRNRALGDVIKWKWDLIPLGCVLSPWLVSLGELVKIQRRATNRKEAYNSRSKDRNDAGKHWQLERVPWESLEGSGPAFVLDFWSQNHDRASLWCFKPLSLW